MCSAKKDARQSAKGGGRFPPHEGSEAPPARGRTSRGPGDGGGNMEVEKEGEPALGAGEMEE